MYPALHLQSYCAYPVQERFSLDLSDFVCSACHLRQDDEQWVSVYRPSCELKKCPFDLKHLPVETMNTRLVVLGERKGMRMFDNRNVNVRR